MMFAKALVLAVSLAAAVAEPPVNHGYLPPVTGPPGYNYPTPNQPLNPTPTPFRPPPPPPQRPTYGPPSPPAYSPAPPSYSPAPPAYSPAPPAYNPSPRPTYGSPVPPPSPPRPVPSYGPPPPPARPVPSYGPPAPPQNVPRPGPSYGPPTGSGTAPRPGVLPPQRPIVPGGNLQSDYPTGPSGDGHDHHDHHHHHEPGMPFDFNYAVKDDYHGTDYSHNAVSDGDVVRGEYKVQLPDGRLQIVSYTADWKNGFNADVRYEGEPTYPPQTQNQAGASVRSGSYQAPPSGSGPY